MTKVFAVMLAAGLLAAGSTSAAPLKAEFTVAPGGNDGWSGRPDAPNKAKTDGPFATLDRARLAVRELKAREPGRKTPIVVQVRRGLYLLQDALTFTAEDSGTPEAPVIYAAYPNERPVFSGGTRLTGFKRDAKGRWVLRIPEVARGEWYFEQLFVNGQRRYRPRLPKDSYYRVEKELAPSEKAQGKGFDRFGYSEGDIRPDWHNLEDVNLLCFQSWTMARMRIGSVDAEKRHVYFSAPTLNTQWYFALKPGQRYIVENVYEALERPGEWYLDRKSGELTYIPMPGETMERTVVIAPRIERLMQLKGDAALGMFVEHLTFRGLTFAHGNWVTPPQGHQAPQAEVHTPGAVVADSARHCTWDGCRITQVGTYGIELGRGCKHNRIVNCEITDLGAGGVKLGEQHGRPDDVEQPSHNTVHNCLIAHGGRMHPAGIGVWIGATPHNTVSHNDIHDFYYTGISVGWSWGYAQTASHHNTLEWNHIHTIGQGVLSDMGGTYTLGLAPGTVQRYNRIHDVESFSYGGWGIYFDEGTTGMLAENNVVYRTKCAGFDQHYGKENVVRNNVFAFSREAQVTRTRPEEHLSFTFEGNVVAWDEGALLGGNWSGNNYKFDRNLYWHAGKQPFDVAGMPWEKWREKGQDVNSIIADPLFMDPAKDDFRLRPGSPAEKIGFQPFDIRGAGRLTKEPGGKAPAMPPRAFPGPPPPPPPKPVTEDFEETPVGDKAVGAETYEDSDQATARVTDETAASGKRSLKFIDLPGQKNEYNPHVFYKPSLRTGKLVGRVDMRIEPGTHFYYEWRDYATAPFVAGPSLRFAADGTLTANGQALLKIPHGQWVGYEITCVVGKESQAKYDLTIRLPGGAEPKLFRDLPHDPRFKKMEWVGFVANANHAGTFYVDNIDLRPVE